jgi:FAD:protein FMN transferase
MNLNIKKALLLALAAAPAVGAPTQERRVVRSRWLMGTVLELEALGAGDAAADAAFAEVERWNRALASCRHLPSSDNCALERAAGRPVPVSADLFAAAEAALRLARETGGAFDPAHAAPGGWKAARLDAAARAIELPPGGRLDFGGFGKGWALDRAAEVLRARGVRAARLNFGGQVLAFGDPDGRGGWEAVVPGAPAPILIKDQSVAVSGDDQRPGHIVDPATGRPVRRTGFAAALAPTGAEADAWSTALFVLGRTPPSFRGRSFFAPGQNLKTRKGDRT